MLQTFSLLRSCLTSIGISIINIRLSHNHLISMIWSISLERQSSYWIMAQISYWFYVFHGEFPACLLSDWLTGWWKTAGNPEGLKFYAPVVGSVPFIHLPISIFFLIFQKFLLKALYHIHIWLVSPKMSYHTWMRYSIGSQCFGISEKLEKITD